PNRAIFIFCRCAPNHFERLSLPASNMLLNWPLGAQAGLPPHHAKNARAGGPGLVAFFMRLSALPLLKRCALGNALHARSFLLGFAATDGFFSSGRRFLLVSSGADLRHALAQPVLQFWYALAGNG